LPSAAHRTVGIDSLVDVPGYIYTRIGKLMNRPLVGVSLAILLAFIGCVEERCTTNQDCPFPRICDAGGRCVYECSEDPQCGSGFTCEGHRCVPSRQRDIECPQDMVPVSNLFCVDRYEASRPDATSTSAGTVSTVAVSMPGVLPWEVDDDNAAAREACAAAGKRLCSPFEWELACRGPAGTIYGYGSKYAPDTCNGLDTFGAGGVTLLPTGALGGCVNGWGAMDMNGNLWEHVAEGDGETVRGGAYNCLDSMTLHRCDYVPRTWVPSALGFRCCLAPEGARGPDPDVRSEPDVIMDVGAPDGGGCLDPDTGPAGEVEVIDVAPECHVDTDCQHLLEDQGSCHLAVCLPGGVCLLATEKEGTPCDDGNPCTVGDSCQIGACEAGAGALECGDDNHCTDDTCVAGFGCEHAPNLEPCEDGNPCTVDDSCAGGSCEGGVNLCDCQTDADCPQDDDLCNGALECDKEAIPYLCVVTPGSIPECEQPPDPCRQATCQPSTGTCLEIDAPDGIPCDDGDECNGPDQCAGGSCEGGAVNLCPCDDDMVSVDGLFCLDRYEASRPDATAISPGTDSSKATSSLGVMPWYPVLHPEASAACQAAGKRLCTQQELDLACAGSAGTAYIYGDDYSATICNGIDTFCSCDPPNCAELIECPYPHCYSQSPSGEYGMGCGAWFHATPTGAFPDCVNEWGAYDINGNVWELVDTGTDESWYTGGAYNCGNSEVLHQCGQLYQGISAKGFRCCRDISGDL